MVVEKSANQKAGSLIAAKPPENHCKYPHQFGYCSPLGQGCQHWEGENHTLVGLLSQLSPNAQGFIPRKLELFSH